MKKIHILPKDQNKQDAATEIQLEKKMINLSDQLSDGIDLAVNFDLV